MEMNKSARCELRPNPSAPRDGGEVWRILSTKNNWSSDELSQLLEEQIEKRSYILGKKSAAEKESERLATISKRDVKTEMEELRETFDKLKGMISKMSKDKLPSKLERPDFYVNVEKADELEKSAAYLTVMNFITATSDQVEANMESDLEAEAIELFNRLKRIEIAYLNRSDCSYLQNYGKKMVAFWEFKLKEKLTKDFEALLETFGWPLRIKTATPTLECHEKFHKIILNLSRYSASIREGEEHEDCLNKRDRESSFVPILPVQVLMNSIKRRFRFHFMSEKPTSESSRPEWYFSQVKQWLYELMPFVKAHLEPVTVSEIGASSVIEFVRCVSEMMVIKVDGHLRDDLRDSVFVKILEESIMFENDIGEFVDENATSLTSSYLPPFVNTVFSCHSVLKRWLAAERRACLEKLDDMFASPSAWNKSVVPGFPEIVDLFMAVIRSLIDRFAHLKKLPQRQQFLLLLNDLLEEFHLRCLQTWKSKTEFDEYRSKDVLIDYVIADSLLSIHEILQEWEYLPFFASLSFEFSGIEEAVNDSPMFTILSTGFSKLNDTGHSHEGRNNGVFSNACALYWCLAEEIQSQWCSRFLGQLKDDMNSYAKLKWQSQENSNASERLNEQLIRVLQPLKDIAKAVSSSMEKKGAEKWMKKLAVKLDELLIETVIFPNQFTRSGVAQLYFDFVHGIFPVFSEFAINEKLFFGSVSSALTILQLSTGEALLLYDTLMNGNFEAHEVALAELNISICQSDVIKVLRNRSDLHF